MAKTQKIIIKIIVAFCISLCLFSAAFSAPEGETAYAYTLLDGDNPNSEYNPYIIATPSDMLQLSNDVLSGDVNGGYYKLAADIILPAAFLPIGNISNQFSGTFDGDNFTVTADFSSFTSNNTYSGIFGVIGTGGKVKNLRVAGEIKGGSNTGAIAGQNHGSIEGCVNTASVTAAAATSDVQGIGGIAGANYGAITDCINQGTVRANNYAGGITGKNLTVGNSIGTLNGIINLGRITFIAGANSYVAAGLAGWNEGRVKNGYNYALIDNKGDGIGSLIGYFTSVAVLSENRNCYNNTNATIIKLIGINMQSALPSNYTAYDQYDFLGRSTLVFESGIMTVPEFDTGYGYFPLLNRFLDDSSVKNLVRQGLFSAGNGCQETPFIIANSMQWSLFAANTRIHDYDGFYVRLDANIEQTVPLSTDTLPFNGHFDGNGKTVSLAILTNANGGMFRAVGENGYISNFNITGWVDVSGGSYAGSVAGILYGKVNNITTSANIWADSYAGGIAGLIYNVSGQFPVLSGGIVNSGEVKGISYIGGIAGSGYLVTADGQVVNYGAVSGNETTPGSYFGGIFGHIDNHDTSVQYYNLLNFGPVTAPKAQYVGGLIGKIGRGEIIGGMNLGAVTGLTYVGGAAGDASDSAISSTAVSCDITGASWVGGYIGRANAATVSNSYFSGRLYKLKNATVDVSTFRLISPSGVGGNVYYNADLIDSEGITDTTLFVPSSQGTAASYIQLTDVNGSAHAISFDNHENWIFTAKTSAYGHYPVPSGFSTGATSNALAAVKYTYFASGEGTSVSPFTVAKPQQLYNLSYLLNNYDGYSALYYRQSANITLDAGFTPIGNEDRPFSGTYTGGYKINGLNVASGVYAGMFGFVSNAVITGVKLNSGSVVGGYAGGIAGYAANSTVSDCYSLLNVSGSLWTGGIVGMSNATVILRCFNAGKIVGGGNFVGGVAGEGNAASRTEYCFNTGTVTGNGAAAGGIIGYNNGGGIFACYNSGTVTVTADSYVGGIAADSMGTIQNTYTIAKIIYVAAGKAGAIAGRVSTGVENHLNSSYYNSDITSLYPHSGTTTTVNNARSTEQFASAGFVNGFTVTTIFTFAGLADTKDSRHAPRLSVFTGGLDADVENYSILSARLRIFAWDDGSDAAWGTQGNPYVITNRSQLSSLSALSATYDYNGNYFILSNDIDMRIGGAVANFAPIGSYSDPQNNRPFNGVFDGRGHTLSYLYINSAVNSTGFIGYLGPNGSIINLTVDANSEIRTTGSYVGSIVGRNASLSGGIDRCVSYASVYGAANVGGIVGNTLSNTKVTNCLFDGALTGSSAVYGVVGINTGSSVNVNTANSWYIFRYQSVLHGDYIERGKEMYQNNGYNTTLYVDKNGAVLVTVDHSAANSGFIRFTLLPEAGFTGYYMDGNDNIVGDNAVYYSINNTTLTSMYCRFTLPLNTAVSGGSADIEGAGRYYSGQEAVLKVTISEYGYFLNIFDTLGNIKEEYRSYKISNVNEQIWLTFAMPHGIASAKTVEIELLSAAGYVELTADGGTYDGTAHNASAILVANGGDYFGEISLRYYLGALKTPVANTVYAGEYEVRALLTAADAFGLEGVFLGIMSAEFTVGKRALSLSGSWDWEGILGKEYDGVVFKNSVAVTSNIEGIIASDTGSVAVLASIYWSSADAGTGLDISATGFSVSGSLSGNYTITSSLEIFGYGIGVITAKAVSVSIAPAGLSRTYNKAKPAVTNYTVTGSLGAVELVFGFTLVDGQGEPVGGWTGNTWNAGIYLVEVSAQNTNYSVSLSEEYYLTITPIIVNSVTYSGHGNLTYTASNLAVSISGIYSTLYSDTDNVILTYFYADDFDTPIAAVVNAGAYTAKPSVKAGVVNYVLSEQINNLTFTVKKATRAENLAVSLSKGDVTVGSDNAVLSVGNRNSDGIISIAKSYASQRGLAYLSQTDGIFVVIPVSYGEFSFTVMETDCQNYNDRQSAELSLTINAGVIYIGVADRESGDRTWHYGDNIALTLQYSTDIGQENILNEEFLSALTGFVMPEYYITDPNLFVRTASYEVKIVGAKSDGYRFYTAANNDIYIAKRPVLVIVDNDVNSKVYGESDQAINFSVKDELTNYITDTLPDGRPLSLSGALVRALGENAGQYAISEGTIRSSNNPNFDISFNIIGKFEIIKRGIMLVMPTYYKNYGQPDPLLVPQVAADYFFVDGDGIAQLNISISRQSGENVGGYNYILGEYDGGINYDLRGVDTTALFIINKASPTIKQLSNPSVIWGETLSTAAIYAAASNLGVSVKGTFRWKSGAAVVTDQTSALATFIPDDSNIESRDFTVELNILQRELFVDFSGVFDYIYEGKEISRKFTLSVRNAVGGYTPAVEIEEISLKNAGTYNIKAKLTSSGGGYYKLASDFYAVIKIYPATVTVMVDGGEIIAGQSYIPTISYFGFKNGENESVLTKAAQVTSLPAEVGYYSVVASGAESPNYSFTYQASSLVIKKAQAVGENIKLSGALSPETTVSAYNMSNKSEEFKDVGSDIDNAVGSSIFKPGRYELAEYIKLEITGEVSENTRYEVTMKTQIAQGSPLYIVYADGSIQELINYNINSDGNIEFTAGKIKGVGIMQSRPATSYAATYLSLAGIALGAIGIVVLIIFLAGSGRRKEKLRRKTYLR